MLIGSRALPWLAAGALVLALVWSRLDRPVFTAQGEGAASDRAADLNREGLARFDRADYDGALRAFEMALAARPNDAVIRRNVGAAHGALGWEAVRRSAWEDAQARFEQAVAISAGESAHHTGLAVVLRHHGQDDEALRALESALALNPTDPAANDLAGDLWYERNDFERALAAWETAQRAKPADAALGDKLAKLRRDAPRLAGLSREETRRFTLLFEGQGPSNRVSRVRDLLEDAYRLVGARLNWYPDRPISVVIYTDQEFRDVTRSPAWTKALFDGKIHLPVGGPLDDDALLRRLVVHELTHAFVFELGRGRVPTWLNEGLAQWFETEGAERPSITPGVPLSVLHGSFLALDEAGAEAAYAQSLSAAAALIDRAGLVRLRSLVEALAGNQPFAPAFEHTYLISYEAFESEWRMTAERS